MTTPGSALPLLLLSIGLSIGSMPPASALAADAEPEDELETVVVAATRSGNLVRDEAIRVEVLPEEEIEENLTVQPGNLTTLLNELAGVRMQSSAPALGGAVLRMRGLPGRHTRVLLDGLPLLGAQTGGFGLLQAPPLDLARVELIKGVGSALYGSGALGGVLNLMSRRPDGEPEFLLNRSSTEATDLVGFASTQASRHTGITLIGGANDQSFRDVDHDRWADLPAYRRYTLRPRLFHDGDGQALFGTLGFVDEDRRGGTLPGQALPDGSVVRDGLATRRIDAGLVLDQSLGGDLRFGTRWSASRTASDRHFEADRVRSVLTTGSGEATLGGRRGNQAWLVGLGLDYETLRSSDAPASEYRHVVPAVFAQHEFSPAESLKLSASARLDRHSVYGSFLSPRLSALFRPTEDFSARLSAGAGFAAPTPRFEEIEATSLARLERPTGLRAERAQSVSLDVNWRDEGWEVDASLFASTIRHPLAARASTDDPSKWSLVNVRGENRIRGAELLVHRVEGVLHFIGSTTWLDATEADPQGGRRPADRTPHWSGELAALFEDEERGRIGIELGYTGRQPLADNPYRSTGSAYFELGVLAAIRIGGATVFFNAENLTNVRQTRYDPLLRPTPLATGERTVGLWAPVAGRAFNLGIRAEL